MHELIKATVSRPFPFPLLFAAMIWNGLLILASIIYRKSRGKVIRPSEPKNALFYEGWASGNSDQGSGSLSRCLGVAVLPEALVIQPRFPFTLFFIPEMCDLEHYIPGANIRFAEVKKRLFGRKVEIGFTDSNGASRSVTLLLKRPDEFLAALGNISSAVRDRTGSVDQ